MKLIYATSALLSGNVKKIVSKSWETTYHETMFIQKLPELRAEF